jgi:hypothetical protein
MKLSKEQIEKNKYIGIGFLDWNTLTLDQMVEYLEEKHKLSSTGEAKCIFELIKYYKDNQTNQEEIK